MTTRSKYIAETNELQELSDYEQPPDRPNPKFYSSSQTEMYQRHIEAWEIVMKGYNANKAQYEKTLRLIPCDPSCREAFKDGEEYEEGKDYKVKEADYYVCHHCHDQGYKSGIEYACRYCNPDGSWRNVSGRPKGKKLTAFPIKVKTEDELWREALDTLVGAGHYAVRANHVIEELKKHYTLIKK